MPRQRFLVDAATARTPSRINTEDFGEDEHVKAVDLLPVVERPTEGACYVIRPPVSFSKAPYVLRRHATALGEHT